jgi:hypothetical protein
LLIVASLVALLGASMQRAARSSRITPAVVPWVADPLQAANAALDAGRYPEALAYYLQVPEGAHDDSRAQRFIGWKLYGDELNRPMAGLSYVHRALLREPFSENSWEDAARVYGSAIGGLFDKKP